MSAPFHLKVIAIQPWEKITYKQHSIRNVRTCAPSEDSDQTAHSHSLIRIFTERILVAKDAKFLHAHNEDSDQTATMLGRFDSSLGAHVWRYVVCRCGSFVYKCKNIDYCLLINSDEFSCSSNTKYLIVTIFYRNPHPKCEQCRRCSDTAFSCVWSGSRLFAKVPFIGR